MDAFEITALFGGVIFLAAGVICLLETDKAMAINKRCTRWLAKKGSAATPFQEKVLCWIAGAGFLLLGLVLLVR